MTLPRDLVPICPAHGLHGSMVPRDPAAMSRQQAWCGEWYDCQHCTSSLLQPSPALTRWLGTPTGEHARILGEHSTDPVEETVVDTREQDAVAVPHPLRTSTSAHGYKILHPAPGTSLQEAREWMRMHQPEGALCPVCKQVAKEYRRTIHAAMAEKLIQFWRAYGTMTWGERTPLMLRGRAGAADGGGDFAKLRYWGLIEEADDVERQDGGRAGWWRVTPLGARFVLNEYAPPRYAFVYDGQLRRLDGPHWNIVSCLGKRFDYNLLMGQAI